ncbi:MAG: hypothetical protein KA140_01345 [Caldisericia bacterium]|nr:hypothetical protein [Caldisericia bacterium]
MKDRKKQFLASVINLYAETGQPVHYSDVAAKMGISSFTAYDAMLDLEKQGLLKRVYSTHDSRGKARAYFEPTDNVLLSRNDQKYSLMDALSFANYILMLAWMNKSEAVKVIIDRFKELDTDNIVEFFKTLIADFFNDEHLRKPILSILQDKKMKHLSKSFGSVLNSLSRMEKQLLITAVENFFKLAGYAY